MTIEYYLISKSTSEKLRLLRAKITKFENTVQAFIQDIEDIENHHHYISIDELKHFTIFKRLWEMKGVTNIGRSYYPISGPCFKWNLEAKVLETLMQHDDILYVVDETYNYYDDGRMYSYDEFMFLIKDCKHEN